MPAIGIQGNLQHRINRAGDSSIFDNERRLKWRFAILYTDSKPFSLF